VEMHNLIRFGVSMSKELLQRFDNEIVAKGYQNRSEAVRDLIRNRLIEQEWSGNDDTEVAGTITLVYCHPTRGLTELLTEMQHHFHHIIISTMHCHLDHDHCLEVLVVKGLARETKEVASTLIGVKGVIHGRLSITSTGKNLG